LRLIIRATVGTKSLLARLADLVEVPRWPVRTLDPVLADDFHGLSVFIELHEVPEQEVDCGRR
jgi:hypothetical protein